MKYALTIFVFFVCSLEASFSQYTLPINHPLHVTLDRLFSDPNVIASREELTMAGFELLPHHHRGLAVVKHPELTNHLIKLFINNVPHDLQVQNYVSRIQGSLALREFIATRRLKHIVTPKKWLYRLPENDLGITYVLVAEKINIVDRAQTKQAYATIAPVVLKELCEVVTEFRGLDSVIKNMPFTFDGKIAFVDTEKWNTERSTFLPHVLPLLDESLYPIIKRYIEVDESESVDEWLMHETHPDYIRLQNLFSDRSLFDSSEALKAAGFEVNKRARKNLMVFWHPTMPDYMFKKFRNSVDTRHQLDKYTQRLQGARIIRNVIKQNNFKNVVIPNKWLFKLPFADDEYLVVAERLSILPGDDDHKKENVQAYRSISEETLYELCTVMKLVGGCDAYPRNQPFTKDGKIAFVDTEHVGQKEAHFLRNISPFLDAKKQELAKSWLYE
ncbi:MAG: hypothetical protein LLF94_11380 [Chlamydiales bacterium]|nr:hypothetical protein [Chlamydiales bacterium]